MDSVLIIGAGAAGSVTAQKCAMNRDVFKKVHLASRRLASCETVAKQCKTPIEISQVDADNVNETVTLIEEGQARPRHQHGAALPGPADHGRVPRRRACTTWTRPTTSRATSPSSSTRGSGRIQDRYKDAGIMAILGCGFDPGQSNIYCAYAQEFLFDDDRDDRHHRLQRRQPRQGVRDQLQSRDQSARGHAARQVLEGRQVDRHRSAVDLHA